MTHLLDKTADLMNNMKKKEKGTVEYLIIENFGDTSFAKTPGLKNSIFREFTPVKSEKGRKLNPLYDSSFNSYKDTLMDYPTIVQYKLGKIESSWRDYNRYLSLHVARCPINCWHCYLDECLRTQCKFCMNLDNCTFKKTRQNVKEGWYSAKKIIESFIEQREKDKKSDIKSNILRLTGGEPFLVPQLHLDLLKELDRRGLKQEIFLWTETNLIPLIKENDKTTLVSDDLLENLSEFDNYCVHPCFHGLDEQNFKENTGNEIKIDNLISALNRLYEHEIDVYPTFGSNATPPKIIEKFYQKIAKINPLLPSKFNLIEFDLNYDPVNWRHENIEGFSSQHEKVYDRFKVIKNWDDLLYENTGYHYADIPRHLIPLYAGVKL